MSLRDKTSLVMIAITLLLYALCAFSVGSGARTTATAIAHVNETGHVPSWFALKSKQPYNDTHVIDLGHVPSWLALKSKQPYNETVIDNHVNDSSYSHSRNLRAKAYVRENTRTHIVMEFLIMLNCVLALSCIVLMMPHHGGNSSKQCPIWGPNLNHSYTFAMWQRDCLLWTISSNLEPPQQASMILQSLRGGARELTRDLPMEVITQGAILNGRQVDGVTYIIHMLAERYAQLGEETRLKAITDMMMFHRRHRESTDELLTRFEITRHRAHDGGGFNMGIEGLTWLLLKACQVNETQLLDLLRPTNGRFPTTEVELRQLMTAIRRMGHVLEHQPDNLAAQLRNTHTQAYMVNAWQQDGPLGWSDSGNSWNHTNSYWTGNGNSYTGTGWNESDWGNHSQAYPGFTNDIDSGTDTDTSSSVGENHYDMSDVPTGNDDVIAEHLFWAYRHHKGRYRRFMRKPVRRVRRFFKRRGKGRGKHSGFFLANMTDSEVTETFFQKGFKGRGKGKGKRSSGKGFGRRQNPKGKNGEILNCRKCGSTEHFIKDCPQANGTPATPVMFAGFVQTNDNETVSEGPLTSLLSTSSHERFYVVNFDIGDDRD